MAETTASLPVGAVETAFAGRPVWPGIVLDVTFSGVVVSQQVRDIEFETEDSAQALIIAQREARKHPAELWRDGEKLCPIRRQSSEVWEIVSVQEYLLRE